MSVNNNSAFSYVKTGAYYLTFPISGPLYYMWGSTPKDAVKELEHKVSEKAEELLGKLSDENRMLLESKVNEYVQNQSTPEKNPEIIESELISTCGEAVRQHFSNVYLSLSEKMDVSLEGQSKLEKVKQKLDSIYKEKFQSVQELENVAKEINEAALEINSIYYHESIRIKPTDEEFLCRVENNLNLKRKGLEKGPETMFIIVRDHMAKQMDYYKGCAPQEFRDQTVDYMRQNIEQFEVGIISKLEEDAQAIKAMKLPDEFAVKMAKYDPNSPLYKALEELYKNRHDRNFRNAVDHLKSSAGVDLYLKSMKMKGTAATELELWALSEFYSLGVMAHHPAYPNGAMQSEGKLALHVVKTDAVNFDVLL